MPKISGTLIIWSVDGEQMAPAEDNTAIPTATNTATQEIGKSI